MSNIDYMKQEHTKLKQFAPYINFFSIIFNLIILLVLFTWRNLLTPVLIAIAIFAIPIIIARVQFPMSQNDERDELIAGMVADKTMKLFSGLLFITSIVFGLALLEFKSHELVVVIAVISSLGVCMKWVHVFVNDGYYQINTDESLKEKLWYVPFVIVSIIGITWYIESLESLLQALNRLNVMYFLGSLLVTPLFVWVYRKKMGEFDERLQKIVSDSSRYALKFISPTIIIAASILVIIYIITLKVSVLVAAITISYLYLLLYAIYSWAYKDVSQALT